MLTRQQIYSNTTLGLPELIKSSFPECLNNKKSGPPVTECRSRTKKHSGKKKKAFSRGIWSLLRFSDWHLQLARTSRELGVNITHFIWFQILITITYLSMKVKVRFPNTRGLFSIVEQFDSCSHRVKTHTLCTVLDGKDIYKASSIIHFNICWIMWECVVFCNLPVCMNKWRIHTAFLSGHHMVF